MMIKRKDKREPRYYISPLNSKMLNYSVYYMSKSEKLVYLLATFVIGGLVGLVFYGGLFKVDGEATTATYISSTIIFCLIGGILAKLFMPAIVNNLKRKRDGKLQKQFMDLLESLSASLSAGNTVTDAFANAYKDMQVQYSEKDMIIVELAEISHGIDNGLTLEKMIADFGVRSCNEDIQNFSNVISNCYRLGGNFNDVVRRTRDIISDKIAISGEIDTKLASNKLQHNAMCIMPIALVAMLKVSSSSFADNLASFTGVLVTTIAVAIFVASYFWGRKIIDIR